METIYKYDIDCGRSGELAGIFIADSDEYDKMIAHGGRLYLGEVLGKHSDVKLDPEKSDFKVISSDPKDVEVVKRLKLEVGFNMVGMWKEKYGEESAT